MPNEWGDAPVSTVPQVNDWGDGPAVEDSPYSRAAQTAQLQALVQSEARRRQLREEADAAALVPRVGIGIRAPFGGPELARFDLPEEVAAFGSEFVKSSPSTAAGIAAASGVMPLASRAGGIPGPVGVAARFGIPLVAGGAAALGTRLAQDELLPQILPENLEQAYADSAELAARNPTSAMLGQLAGAAPFFRPGLPLGTQAADRLRVPVIAGGIGGGIEGAQQISEGEFSPDRLSAAILGTALLNRETALGARIGPNLVLPNISGRAPAELDIVGRTMREPVPTDIVPAELDAMRQAQAITAAETGARRNEAASSLASMDAGVDQRKVQALAERMAGKGVQDQLTILDQELRLQKDTLNEAEMRAGLDMKIMLKQQVEQQKALEAAAKAEQDAIKQAEKGIQAEQKAQADIAAAAAEVPKSAQILAEPAKPAPIANVATEIGTQTSPFALQGELNKLTAPVPPPQQIGAEVAPGQIAAGGETAAAIGQIPPAVASSEVPVAKRPKKGTPAPAEFIGIQEGLLARGNRPAVADIELYNLTADIPGHPAGSSVSRETLEKAGFKVPVRTAPTPDTIPTEVTGLPRSREQALNDAGADLPPISSLKADQKLAELKQGGITTYAGRPIEDANPAQLSNALGKFRRGELTPDGETTRATQSLSKRAEEALTKLKIDTRGKQFDATAGIPIAAYNAAIDTAILAIRAGRALTEVVQMALDRYRKAHPRATDDDILKITEDIEAAYASGVPASALTEAEQIVADAPATTLASGRDAEATQAASRMRQQRGGIPTSVLAPLGGAVTGGAAGYATAPDQQPGESDEAYRARLLTRTAAGAAIGGGALAMGAMKRGAKARQATTPEVKGTETAPAGRVTPPDPGEGQGIRQLAGKVIADTNRATALRQSLADNPEIIYDKFLLGELSDRVQAATTEELNALSRSADRNEQAAGIIELANRAAADGKDAEAADLYAQASTLFTNSAQLLNVAKLVRSPIGYVTAVKDELAALGRTTTPAQDTEIARLGKQSIQEDQRLAKAERAAQQDFSPQNQKAFEDARTAAADAKKKLATYVGEITPKGWDDIIIATIQGNLLTPLSQIANVYGNALFQPVRRGSMAIASGLDAVYSGASGLPRVIDRSLPVPRKEEFEAFADGVKIAAKELITGPGTDSYIKGEVQRGFRPLRSLVQAFTGANLPRTEAGDIALSDRAKKLVEGTIGAPPEAMFRLLNLGDRGFRRAAEIETLMEQARLKKLEGRALEKFLEFPDKETQGLLNTEARKAIFAQENMGVNQLNNFLDTGVAKLLHLDKIPVAKGALKVFGRLNVPFRQFPVNYVMTALNFAVPELALSKALYFSARGDRRKMLTNLGEGIMGSMMYGAAAYLWENGLISEPVDKDAKQRSIQYDNMGGQRINLSGLQRALEGGDPTWQRDDTTVDWGRMGIPAPVFYVYTQDQAKSGKELQRTGVRPVTDTSATGQIIDRIKSYPGIGQFALDQSFLAGSSAFLEALKNGFTGPEADAWAANMFRATSTLAVPNTVEALARANYEYIPELRGDTLGETFKNVWDFKTFQLPKDDRAILKRDIWGEPISRTPPNQNPYVYQFLDVTKSQERQPDAFKASLVKTFNESDNPNTYPTPPDRNMTVQGVTVKLDPKDYESLQALTGRLRRQEVEPIVLDPEFSTIPAGERVAELERVYQSTGTEARQAMLSDEAFRMKYFAEVFGGPPSERVIKRDTSARNRMETAPVEEFWAEDAPARP